MCTATWTRCAGAGSGGPGRRRHRCKGGSCPPKPPHAHARARARAHAHPHAHAHAHAHPHPHSPPTRTFTRTRPCTRTRACACKCKCTSPHSLPHHNHTYTHFLAQAARKIHIAKFRAGRVRLLVVTDVAARGLDIPLLDNVVHYGARPAALWRPASLASVLPPLQPPLQPPLVFVFKHTFHAACARARAAAGGGSWTATRCAAAVLGPNQAGPAPPAPPSHRRLPAQAQAVCAPQRPRGARRPLGNLLQPAHQVG